MPQVSCPGCGRQVPLVEGGSYCERCSNPTYLAPEYEHMRDIIERGPYVGPELDAIDAALDTIRVQVEATPPEDRKDYYIDVRRNGLHVETRYFVPTIEEAARLYFDEECLHYPDCDVVLYEVEEGVVTGIPGMADRVTLTIEILRHTPEEVR